MTWGWWRNLITTSIECNWLSKVCKWEYKCKHVILKWECIFTSKWGGKINTLIHKNAVRSSDSISGYRIFRSTYFPNNLSELFGIFFHICGGRSFFYLGPAGDDNDDDDDDDDDDVEEAENDDDVENVKRGWDAWPPGRGWDSQRWLQIPLTYSALLCFTTLPHTVWHTHKHTQYGTHTHTVWHTHTWKYFSLPNSTL